MATDIIDGLFGLTAEQEQFQRQRMLDQAAMQYAKMAPFERATAGMFRGGAQLADVGAGMLGMQNPAIVEAQRRESALAGIDMSNPQSIMKRSEMVQDPRMKMRLQMLAQEVASKQQTMALESAKAKREEFRIGQEAQWKHEEAMARIAQQAEAAKQRSEDTRLSIEQRREAAREASELRRELATMIGVRGAPSMTEVVDPDDPTRMIRVDAKTYQGGTIGDIGVLGVSGKEPSSAKREEKAAEGKDLLKTELDNLRESYKTLNEARAIPSSSRGGLSNAASWVQGSAAGQLGGRVFGTKEQDARNQIQSARLRVMNAIKNATGMSAQQMNSNVELQTWLQSLTDPTKSYESNMAIIDAIDDAFIKGTESKKQEGSSFSVSTPEEVRTLLRSGKISREHAKTILKDMERRGLF